MNLRFSYQIPGYQLRNATKVKKWLLNVIAEENKNPGLIEYFIIDDDSLRSINEEFLEHHYYTDVITFDYSDEHLVAGEIYISTDTVRFNSKLFGRKYGEEVRRVMVHGLLHLLGFDDRTEPDKVLMKKKEDYYLEKYKS